MSDREYCTVAQVHLLFDDFKKEMLEILDVRNERLTDTLADMFDNEVRRIDHRIDEQGRQINELGRRVTDIERKVTGAPPKRDPLNELPDLSKITKLQAQYFNNRKKPGKKKGEVNQQIKLYVWTCPEEDIAKCVTGNHPILYVPLYMPGYYETRRRLGTKLDYLNIDTRDVKFIGCVTANGQKPTQSAIVYNDFGLKMSIRGEMINFDAPRSKPVDAADNAPLYSWFWRPTS